MKFDLWIQYLDVYAGPLLPFFGRVQVLGVDGVAGRIKCIECRTDHWGKPTETTKCKSCKGSGYMWVGL